MKRSALFLATLMASATCFGASIKEYAYEDDPQEFRGKGGGLIQSIS